MLKMYPREKHRGMCWLDLLATKPVHEEGGFRFQPDDSHFRKHHHTEAGWGWFVYKWRYQGTEIFEEPPCDPPPDCVFEDERSYPYVWATWTEYDGTPACGFMLVGGGW